MAKAHFIPRFYLRGFTDPDVPPGQEPYVWLLRAGEQLWEQRGPGNVAAESDYYVFTDDEGRERTDMESALAGVEGRSAPIIASLGERPCIGNEERGILALFAATMMLRVPTVHEQFGDFVGEVLTQLAMMSHQLYTEHPEQLEALKEQYRVETGRSDLDSLRAEHLDMSRRRITVGGPATVGIPLSVAGDCSAIIARMGWTLTVAEPPAYFVTSDAPLFMVDRTNTSRFYGDGLLNRSIELTLPLTRSVALFAGWQSEGPTRWGVLTRAGVAAVNYRSGMRARRFLIAPKRDFPGSKGLLRGRTPTGEGGG